MQPRPKHYAYPHSKEELMDIYRNQFNAYQRDLKSCRARQIFLLFPTFLIPAAGLYLDLPGLALLGVFNIIFYMGAFFGRNCSGKEVPISKTIESDGGPKITVFDVAPFYLHSRDILQGLFWFGYLLQWVLVFYFALGTGEF